MARKRVAPGSDEEAAQKAPAAEDEENKSESSGVDEPDEQGYGVKQILKHFVGHRRRLAASQKNQGFASIRYPESTVQFLVKWEDDPDTGEQWSLDEYDSWEPAEVFYQPTVDALVTYLAERPHLLAHKQCKRFRKDVSRYLDKHPEVKERAEKAEKEPAYESESPSAASKAVKGKGKVPKDKEKPKETAQSKPKAKAKGKNNERADTEPKRKKRRLASSDEEPLASAVKAAKAKTKPTAADNDDDDDTPLIRATAPKSNASKTPASAPAATPSLLSQMPGGDLDNLDLSDSDEADENLRGLFEGAAKSRPASAERDPNFVAKPILVVDDDSGDEPPSTTARKATKEAKGKEAKEEPAPLPKVRSTHPSSRLSDAHGAQYCKKCKRASCPGKREGKACDFVEVVHPYKSKRPTAHVNDGPANELFDASNDPTVRADRFGVLERTHDYQIDFQAPHIEDYLFNALVNTRFIPERRMTHKRYDENIIAFWRIKEVLSPDISAMLRGKTIKIHAPISKIVKANRKDEFSHDVAALQMLCKRKEAWDCNFDVEEEPDIVFFHISAAGTYKDTRDLALDPLYNRLRRKPGTLFFIFGTHWDRPGGTPTPVFKPIWNVGAVATFTSNAIVENPVRYRELTRAAKKISLFVKLWLHVGLVGPGGRLSWDKENMAKDELSVAMACNLSIGISKNDTSSVHILPPLVIPPARSTKPILIDKPIPTFPTSADHLLKHEVSEWKSASALFAGDEEDELLGTRKLVDMSEILRSRYLTVKQWVVIGSAAEKAAWAQQLEGDKAETAVDVMDMVDFDGLLLDYTP